MNRKMMIAVLTSFLSVGALAATASAASWHWDNGWGLLVGSNVISECFSPSPVAGHSIISGDDPGQVVALCLDSVNSAWDCGSVPGADVGVRARGRTASGASWEYTAPTTGTTAGSSAGGPSIVQHQCQMGF